MTHKTVAHGTDVLPPSAISLVAFWSRLEELPSRVQLYERRGHNLLECLDPRADAPTAGLTTSR